MKQCQNQEYKDTETKIYAQNENEVYRMLKTMNYVF